MRFGLLNGKRVLADNVPRGLACNCICCDCGGKLVACKGEIVAPYFSHYNLEDCEGADMTMLHKEAESRFSVGSKFFIPELKYGEQIIEDGHYSVITKVSNEVYYEDVKPDVVLTLDNVDYFVEIFVTHKVDTIKKTKLNKLGYPTIEIDLSDLYDRFRNPHDLSFELYRELDNILYNDTKFKKWCYHKHVYKLEQDYKLQLLKIKEEQQKNWEEHLLSVRQCPKCESRIYPPKLGDDIIVCENCNFKVSRNKLLENPKMIGMWRQSIWELNKIKEII